LLPQVRFELSKYAKHVEEAFAGRGTRVDRLLGRLERGTNNSFAPSFATFDPGVRYTTRKSCSIA
jgi:hypothetical protein